MKRCPTCEKTFDDNMRFCQADGTPLLDAEPVDPYKTMVARPGEIAAAIPPSFPETTAKDEGEVLQIPANADPLKTMYASEDEIRNAMASKDADEQVIEIPPLVESAALPPEPPRFVEPNLSPPAFGEMTPPPSPFSQAPQESAPTSFPSSGDLIGDPFAHTTPPIPSPFNDMKAAQYDPPMPEPPRFIQPEVAPEPTAFNPFNQPAPVVNAPIVPAEWTPPPAPDAGWQQNTPPVARVAGQNQTLAIISLVLGIISLLFCAGLTGPPALITGMIARKKANNNPSEYGGAGVALAGIITGILGTLLLLLVIAYFVLVLFVMAGSLAF